MKKIYVTLGLIVALSFAANQTYAQHDYDAAVGLRAAWGIGLTGKKFINDDNHAIEAIVNWRSFGFGAFSYGWISITGLYEVHNPLDEVMPGLQWYWGGGANFTTYTGDFDYPGSDLNDSFFGIAGCLGLDYKFEDLPINVSLDWIPVIGFGGYGFGAEGGGAAVRYAF